MNANVCRKAAPIRRPIYRHEWVSNGMKLSRIYQLESLANGWDAMFTSRAIHENQNQIFPKGSAPAMDPVELEERMRFGMADSQERIKAFDDEFARMVAIIEGR